MRECGFESKSDVLLQKKVSLLFLSVGSNGICGLVGSRNVLFLRTCYGVKCIVWCLKKLAY